MTIDPSQPSADEAERYRRQTILPEIGADGQARLHRSAMLIVGAGGLGSPVAMYLAASGVGRLGIVDDDVVDLGNLQRQIIHGTGDLGMTKTASAAKRIRDINPNCEVIAHNLRLTRANAQAIVAGYDIVLGCVDNFEARRGINAACVALNKPNIFGTVARFEGQASVFTLDDGPCYQCFFRAPPDDAATPAIDKGVLGPVPGVIGSIQANEAMKIAIGMGQTLSGRLLLYDALRLRFRELAIKRDPACPVCGSAARKQESL